MANGRTRKTEDRLSKAREFTRTTARYEPDVKPADAYRRLESWRQDKIARGVVDSDNDLYQIPEIQHFRRWLKADLDIINQENFREWIIQYLPQEMHTNPFWNTPDSPYKLGGFEKDFLLKVYNHLQDRWFAPLGITPPLMTVSQAVWICILVNTNPLLNRVPRLIDVWLYAEYCSSIHLDKMHDTDVPEVTPTSNPVHALDKGVWDYINSTAWDLVSDYARYKNLVKNGTYEKINYVWDKQQLRLEPSKNLNNRKAWELQFPMLYGSQIPNMDSLPPLYKVLRFLQLYCLEVLALLQKEKLVTDEHMFDWHKTRCEQVGKWVDEQLDVKGVEVVQFKQTDIEEGNDMFQLGTFDKYFKLMLSLCKHFYTQQGAQGLYLEERMYQIFSNTFHTYGSLTLKDFTSMKDYPPPPVPKG